MSPFQPLTETPCPVPQELSLRVCFGESVSRAWRDARRLQTDAISRSFVLTRLRVLGQGRRGFGTTGGVNFMLNGDTLGARDAFIADGASRAIETVKNGAQELFGHSNQGCLSETMEVIGSRMDLRNGTLFICTPTANVRITGTIG